MWIDSCCIVQDSADDWLHEAKMMEKVYKNTSLNISADHSKNATGGCFTERLAQGVAPCRYETPRKRWVEFVPSTITLSLRDSALSNRAWVVQERFMSPRVLHFTADQLFWECSNLFACETFPDGMADFLDHRASWHYRTNWSLALNNQRGKPNHHEIWRRICEEYSRGALTDPSDKLIAFSGIAREFQSQLAWDKYLAGLWQGDLVLGLLWQVGKPCRASPTPTFRAPSWSWLSNEGHVWWLRSLDRRTRSIVRVLEATVDLVNDGDPSGQMRGGSIVVRGHLRSASWKREDGFDAVVLDGKHGDPMHELRPILEVSGCFLLTRDTESMFPAKEISCLLLSRYLFDGRSLETIEGLVLRSTEVKDTYQRIGHFQAIGSLACMALKYRLRPLAQEMDRPWDRLRVPRLSRAKRIIHWFRNRAKHRYLHLTSGSDSSEESDAETRLADAYLGDAPYDKTLFEKLEERTITLI
jgi:Heterokaryon incompatibility protein (HET)